MPIEPSATTVRSDLNSAGSVAGLPLLLLRCEGGAVFAAAAIAYSQSGEGWWMAAILFFVPDAVMLGYLAGPRVGAIAYNLGHSYLVPALVAATAWLFDLGVLLPVTLVWIAHIGLDRMLGYGLKYRSGFGATHLGRVGRRAATERPR
ncbi:hypothetical protein BZG35_16350 [Brevundimonas sp. LM2]|uniref:DUF4260 domain-containing protein n=1 Tax=Brevundimonas sp. LM2 TaxID=1938605 RepID=UPI000983BC38|nr:DUF4260 domain-containing protein [Brevundimonas sp. LM2]AQR63053.1 hypothetical protein BZG35_16350 [Brevundimonas sp. LM2]